MTLLCLAKASANKLQTLKLTTFGPISENGVYKFITAVDVF